MAIAKTVMDEIINVIEEIDFTNQALNKMAKINIRYRKICGNLFPYLYTKEY